ncbi:MAG: RNA helicase, partial [Prochlorococcaceae cyanobacterium ETNP1_MAG_9]|nr:RNA helicase [Prochlorococcaceae cyanobacterium ETNP1_MAG_9]
MDSDRLRPQRRQGYRQPLERRLDNWIQTGRQVVDGVAGNRPGMKKGNSSRSAVNSVEKVGRWVGDKLDWFLEDEDGWLEPWQAANQETDEETYSTSKRPLDAVS